MGRARTVPIGRIHVPVARRDVQSANNPFGDLIFMFSSPFGDNTEDAVPALDRFVSRPIDNPAAPAIACTRETQQQSRSIAKFRKATDRRALLSQSTPPPMTVKRNVPSSRNFVEAQGPRRIALPALTRDHPPPHPRSTR
jgi:hypothetical protein